MCSLFPLLLLVLAPCKAFYVSSLTKDGHNHIILKDTLVKPSTSSSHLTLSEQSKDMDSSLETSKSTAVSSNENKLEEKEAHKNLHYPTAGGMYDISEGPGHHLINVDHDKLHDVEEIRSVNVHEVKVDAFTVTFVAFVAMASLLIVLAFLGEDGSGTGGVLNTFIARMQNYMT